MSTIAAFCMLAIVAEPSKFEPKDLGGPSIGAALVSVADSGIVDKLPTRKGVLVRHSLKDGPAEKAGIFDLSIITAIDKQPVDDLESWKAIFDTLICWRHDIDRRPDLVYKKSRSLRGPKVHNSNGRRATGCIIIAGSL